MNRERRATWLTGLLGGGLAWTLHLMGSYALVTLGCAGALSDAGLLLAVLTTVCAALAVASGVGAYRARRSGRGGDERWPPERTEPLRFALGVGAGLSALFALLIALGGLIPLVVPLCAVPS